MDKIRVVGGNRLNGTIPISGAKNAALPLMIASLLTDETLTLTNVPQLADVRLLSKILENHGTIVTGNKDGVSSNHLALTANEITSTLAPYDLVSKMRASFWVIGPLVARMGEARVSLPGGCAIGTRPVDFFLDGLKEFGAEITVEEGYAIATAKDGLVGADITFPKVSVGATHTMMMAATLAKGTTRLINAACEPEVADLAQCLSAMGAEISGAGTSEITIEGVERLHGAEHHVLADRIETGTYAIAVAAAGGDVVLEGARADLLEEPLDLLRKTGASITVTNEGLRVQRNGAGITAVNMETDPYPGFPTDLQAQYMALMTTAEGTSKITETIFENRFMHVAELARLGADIQLDGQVAKVNGNADLRGAQVMATDLRASVSLVIAGLMAEGETTISRIYHLDRGFEQLEEKLSRCGAQIERISD